MKRGEIYQSGWIKAKDMLDLGQTDGLNLTVKKVRTGELNDGTVQGILAFNEDERELGLNVTNWNAMVEITGQEDGDDWLGSKINVYPHKLDRPYQGATHGVRVRAIAGAKAATPPANTSTPPNTSLPDNTAARQACWSAFLKKTGGLTEGARKSAWLLMFSQKFPGGVAAKDMPAADLMALAAWIEKSYSLEAKAPSEMDDNDIPF
jgi:hypothetical protein